MLYIVLLVLVGCDLSGPEELTQGSPEIEFVQPDSGRFNDMVTIGGKNFSTNPDNNLVTFNGKQAVVAEASGEELMVRVPSRPGSGPIRVEVHGNATRELPFQFIPTITVTTWAGKASQGSNDGDDETARFNNPWGIEVSERGTVFIGDFNNNAIRVIGRDREVSTLTRELNHPMGLQLAVNGLIYVADAFNNMIKTVSLDGTVQHFAGSGFTGDRDGDRLEASFNLPSDVTASSKSLTFYIADALNNKIRMISPEGLVSTLAGSRSRGFQDGTGDVARFFRPVSLALNEDESTLFIADFFNHSIRMIDLKTQAVTTLAGDGTPGYRDGPVSEAKFNRPFGITIDRDGTLYVADSQNHVIRKISEGTVSTLAGTGVSGLKNGDGGVAQFNNPYQVVVTKNGGSLLYVADRDNDVIRRLEIE
ncbi:MAG: IPT/TIG domain-containing protein [Balneolaceae bacterium]|nr:IPT/TIG domain-containing protein [Balneolaceae bacterium]